MFCAVLVETRRPDVGKTSNALHLFLFIYIDIAKGICPLFPGIFSHFPENVSYLVRRIRQYDRINNTISVDKYRTFMVCSSMKGHIDQKVCTISGPCHVKSSTGKERGEM